MALGRRIAGLKFKELFGLCFVFLKRPLYLIPTYNATNKTVAICNRLYGELHHEDNRTNAFRHALWNYSICKHCLPITGSIEKTISWSKMVTDLHEQLAPNEDLSKKMDLHNNRIGRELFLNSYGKEIDEIAVLQQMTREAIQVKSLAEFKVKPERLVFIERIKN